MTANLQLNKILWSWISKVLHYRSKGRISENEIKIDHGCNTPTTIKTFRFCTS